MKQKTHLESPSRTLQILFLVGVIGNFIIQAVQTGIQIISQLPTNQNLSGYIWWILPGFALPIILTLIAVAVKKDKTLNVPNAFAVTLLVVSIVLFGGLIGSLASAITMYARIVIFDYMTNFILYTAIPLVASLIFFVILLVILRRKKQW